MGLRIVLAEDAPLIRAGIISLLERAGHDVLAWVDDARALAPAVEEHMPDVVVTDVRMPPCNGDDGLAAAVDLRRRRPGMPVLVLSQYVATAYLDDLLASDGRGVGYLLKERVSDVREFVASLETIAAGGTVIDPEVVRTMIAGHQATPLDRLTPRERDVLALVAEGQSNAQIAEGLCLTEAAVVKHIGSILAKLDLPADAEGNRRVLAVLMWLRHRR